MFSSIVTKAFLEIFSASTAAEDRFYGALGHGAFGTGLS